MIAHCQHDGRLRLAPGKRDSDRSAPTSLPPGGHARRGDGRRHARLHDARALELRRIVVHGGDHALDGRFQRSPSTLHRGSDFYDVSDRGRRRYRGLLLRNHRAIFDQRRTTWNASEATHAEKDRSVGRSCDRLRVRPSGPASHTRPRPAGARPRSRRRRRAPSARPCESGPRRPFPCRCARRPRPR